MISTFRFHSIEGIKDFIYCDAYAEWLHCVVGHRKANTFPNVVEEMKKYDIIAGKIADDATNVKCYHTGLFSCGLRCDWQ